jgi:hypothetical protein
VKENCLKTEDLPNQKEHKICEKFQNSQKGNFDMENDPDRPENAINMSVIIEEIDINGNI